LAEQLVAAAGLPSAAEEMAHPAGSDQQGRDQADASKPIGTSLVLMLLQVSAWLCFLIQSWQMQHSMMHMHLAGLANGLYMILMHDSDVKVESASLMMWASWLSSATGFWLLGLPVGYPCCLYMQQWLIWMESSALQGLQAACAWATEHHEQQHK